MFNLYIFLPYLNLSCLFAGLFKMSCQFNSFFVCARSVINIYRGDFYIRTLIKHYLWIIYAHILYFFEHISLFRVFFVRVSASILFYTLIIGMEVEFFALEKDFFQNVDDIIFRIVQ